MKTYTEYDLYIVALELNRQTLVKHIPSQYVKEVA